MSHSYETRRPVDAGEPETQRVQIGDHCRVEDNVHLATAYDVHQRPTVIGDCAAIRAGTNIYANVTIGDNLRTGHNALIREGTTIGDDVLVGTNTVIDGQTTIGSRVSLQTNVYIPTNTTIGNDVFVGPGVTMTNDMYPIRKEFDLVGPTLEDGVSIGANATILPGVTIGAESFVAAGALVIEDVPPRTLALGVPATHRPLPASLQGRNQIA
ncbi:acyltransferase [Haladaptatus sp. GCM10025707]|uniref:acyltransferase n=1 Tax=unclassified Haladaptatus TaxID=2622732 RepID=UPI0023E773CF|nr:MULTISPECIES: acyltransferase [unclassified Haladaptatus]